jgi:hypothetical protein
MATRHPARRVPRTAKDKISPKQVKAGAAAMSSAMMKKVPSPSKLKKRK